MNDEALLKLLDIESTKIGVGLLLFRRLNFEDTGAREHCKNLIGEKRLSHAGSAFDQDVLTNEQCQKDLFDNFRSINDAPFDKFHRRFEVGYERLALKTRWHLHGFKYTDSLNHRDQNSNSGRIPLSLLLPQI